MTGSNIFDDGLAVFAKNEVENRNYTPKNNFTLPRKTERSVWEQTSGQWRQSNELQFAERNVAVPRLDSSISVLRSVTMLEESPKRENKPGLGSWFSNPAAALNNIHDSLMTQDTSEHAKYPTKKTHTATSATTTPSIGIGGRFGNFFNKGKPSPIPPIDDDILGLSLHMALSASDVRDASIKAPQAFNNIKTTAEELLTKAQDGYRARTTELQHLQHEVSARNDEHEEALTRAEHLKLQLEGMAQRVSEYDAQMETLRAELKAEREAWEAQRQAWKASIAEEKPLFPPRRTDTNSRDSLPSSVSALDDDRFALSRNSSTTSSERSSLPVFFQEPDECTSILPSRLRTTIAPNSPYQKVFGKVQKSAVAYSNHSGESEAVARETIRVLRSENTLLKERIASLEAAVDGALDLVAGLSLR